MWLLIGIFIYLIGVYENGFGGKSKKIVNMSIIKHKILDTKYLKQYIQQDCSEEAWQKYLDTIDKEINFIKEWKRSIEDRNKK